MTIEVGDGTESSLAIVRSLRRVLAALSRQAVIDQALGVVMSRAGCTAGEALTRLSALSHAENRELGDVAQRIIDDAVQRARVTQGGH